jgi:hypothetical protein
MVPARRQRLDSTAPAYDRVSVEASGGRYARLIPSRVCARITAADGSGFEER